MGDRMFSAFCWAIVASLLTGQPHIVCIVAVVGLLCILVASVLDHE